uniref:Cysteine-rich membrane protein 2 n=1 Tax=Spironucleus salmonicida TaxID=348837 RepID=V6LAT6_9EUKA|eukprot:EST41527.1 Cysteine-rich membrane protein 2 [Spironucleus salmonicida]
MRVEDIIGQRKRRLTLLMPFLHQRLGIQSSCTSRQLHSNYASDWESSWHVTNTHSPALCQFCQSTSQLVSEILPSDSNIQQDSPCCIKRNFNCGLSQIFRMRDFLYRREITFTGISIFDIGRAVLQFTHSYPAKAYSADPEIDASNTKYPLRLFCGSCACNARAATGTRFTHFCGIAPTTLAIGVTIAVCFVTSLTVYFPHYRKELYVSFAVAPTCMRALCRYNRKQQEVVYGQGSPNYWGSRLGRREIPAIHFTGII